MILAKVLESVVSTQKDATFEGRKIFSIQPLNEKLQPAGTPMLAFDHVQAGPGDVVIVCREGNGCRQMWGLDQAPVNAVIAGIVDSLDL
jgi:ethanolamine utilization protein EutN